MVHAFSLCTLRKGHKFSYCFSFDENKPLVNDYDPIRDGKQTINTLTRELA